ncbi:DUF4019 domain-containing protein [Cerasicoccus arenae]|uniref:Uncharacterized protein n=1 Tax=Cerasicoccus arenae TaxID=424488 RepID=A0A8J3GD11_9BACT|nr:DUF4019 domain-containing protein [Cerasicoccus arenae]MBK1857935.1 DUF4019 domain-containing protein [Cerasicoccus arenae]GHB97963.1 hypothetical protein GCM10007047_12380 [Cerasicoccus arenae]
MKIRHLFFSCLLLIALAAEAAPTVELAARESADKWLKIVDKGEYGEAWAWCAPFFRVQIPREEFVSALTQVRPPLETVESRELVRLFYTTTLPNAPDAHYVVIQYKTKFSGRVEPAFELVTPMLINSEGDPVGVSEDPLTTSGEWQVSGYYIQ